MRIDTEALRDTLAKYTSLNKTRPAGSQHGFSVPEAAALALWLGEQAETYVVAEDKPEKVPAWFSVDQQDGTVLTGNRKAAMVTAWAVKYGVDDTFRTGEGFYPEGVTKQTAKPGQRAYSYIFRKSLTQTVSMILIPGAFLVDHLGEEEAAKIRERAVPLGADQEQASAPDSDQEQETRDAA